MIDHRACTRHRSALIDFVDSGEVSLGTGPALAHLDRCARCTAELEVTAQAITGLRRWSNEFSAAEPRADAWLSLRDRISRWRPIRSALMSPASGMAMSILIVAVLVFPLNLGPGELSGSTPAVSPPTFDAGALELSVDRSRPISLSTAAAPVVRLIDLAGWAGPDGLGVQFQTSGRPTPPRSGSGGPL